MGSKLSPYASVRYYYLAEEFIRGNRLEPHNPLRWDVVELNLPGSESYNPSRPRVIKWDSVLDRMAGDLIAFVDDIRGIGQTVEHAWAVARVIAARLLHLGHQDATGKRKPSKRTPIAWADKKADIYPLDCYPTASVRGMAKAITQDYRFDCCPSSWGRAKFVASQHA
jgi:hypothetical protein